MEKIYVYAVDDVLTTGYVFSGFSSMSKLTLLPDRIIGYIDVRQTDDLEQDKSMKQIIPYVIVVDSDGKIHRYRRGDGSGEARLKSEYSIGTGGHITDNALDYLEEDRGIVSSAMREMSEEVGIYKNDIKSFKLVGHVNEDDSDVSSVQFGLICVVKLKKNAHPHCEFGHVVDAVFVDDYSALSDGEAGKRSEMLSMAGDLCL